MEDILLLSGDITPTGVGISQVKINGDYFLHAISPCCKKWVVFEWNEPYNWKCGGCEKEVPVDGSCERLEVEATRELRSWTSEWTGLNIEDINVEVK